MQAAHPLWAQILFVLLVPGAMAAVLWPIIGGIYAGANGGAMTERAKGRRKFAVRLFLAVMYPIVTGMLVWTYTWPPGTPQPAFARAIAGFFRAPHPWLWDTLSFIFLVPIFALLLWAFGRWLLAVAGIGGTMPSSKRRVLKEWLWVLAAVYAYIAGAALFGMR